MARRMVVALLHRLGQSEKNGFGLTDGEGAGLPLGKNMKLDPGFLDADRCGFARETDGGMGKTLLPSTHDSNCIYRLGYEKQEVLR